jgi:O-antigen/teichoic acid export membrane protein
MTDTPEGTGRSSARQTISGGAWTVAERIIAQVSQLILFVAAARVLSPAEFGVFALVSTCALLFLRMAEVGWAPYIMSWDGDDTIPRQVVMVSILTGLAFGLFGAVVGVGYLLLGLGTITAHLILLFSVWVVIATTCSAQKGMMIWRDGLRGSAIAESLGEIVGMAVALVTLYRGYGVYALVFGRLAYQITHLAISFAVTRRSPLFGMPADELRTLGRYSWQIFSSRFIVNLRLYIATFIIGAFLGPAPVGYYRAAQRLVGSIAEIIGAPSLVLAWSMFRQARDDHGVRTRGFQQQANLYFKLLFALGIPVFIWLTLMGQDLISGLLGPKWLPALPLVGILALARALSLPAAATEPILSLNGEIGRLPLFNLTLLVLTVALTAAGAATGLTAVAWSQVLAALIAAVATNRMLRKHGGIDWREVLMDAGRLVPPVLLGSVVILLARELPVFQSLPALVRAFGVVIPATAIYLLALTATEPAVRDITLSVIRRRIRA